MSVTLTLDRTSHILISFSTEAYTNQQDKQISVRALVGILVANPGSIVLTPKEFYDYSDSRAYTYTLYLPSVSAGTYTIKIQWMVSGGVGYVGSRTLTVIALPA